MRYSLGLGKYPKKPLTEEQRKQHVHRVTLYNKHRCILDPSYVKYLQKFHRRWEQRTEGRTKRCAKCHEEKGWAEFDKHASRHPTLYQWQGGVHNTYHNRKGAYDPDFQPTSRYTLRSECKACRKKYNREYYLKRKQQHDK